MPDTFSVCGLTAGQGGDIFTAQVKEFEPQVIYLADENAQRELQMKNYKIHKDQVDLIRNTEADIVVMAVVGEQGIPLVKAALESGKDVALATKEVIVAAGKEVTTLAQKCGQQILPVDSEHSAIWQCLRAGNADEVAKIWLTCSGGPFCDSKKWPTKELQNITPKQAIKHPKWEMGQKISVDSATLMNKALELIETVYLFGIPHEKIEVVIHPESHLHSAVEFVDGSIVGQFGTPDMRTAISYALTHPKRAQLDFPKLSLFNKNWSFSSVDFTRFPSIGYARKALQTGREAGLNRANEQAVQDFLDNKISFLDIFARVADVLE